MLAAGLLMFQVNTDALLDVQVWLVSLSFVFANPPEYEKIKKMAPGTFSVVSI